MAALDGRLHTLTWLVGVQLWLTLLGVSILGSWLWECLHRLTPPP
jgi:hypothetical protein